VDRALLVVYGGAVRAAHALGQAILAAYGQHFHGTAILCCLQSAFVRKRGGHRGGRLLGRLAGRGHARAGVFGAPLAACAAVASSEAGQRCTLPPFSLLRSLSACPVAAVNLADHMCFFEQGV